ncbi:MAG: hypothetical protein CFE24_10275 [Flavobacterium sp. BFFFF2]|nr:MAG: hypothetical protein CFE24_10275 [Flavobacterium sp. BFFFF2]
MAALLFNQILIMTTILYFLLSNDGKLFFNFDLYYLMSIEYWVVIGNDDRVIFATMFGQLFNLTKMLLICWMLILTKSVLVTGQRQALPLQISMMII